MQPTVAEFDIGKKKQAQSTIDGGCMSARQASEVVAFSEGRSNDLLGFFGAKLIEVNLITWKGEVDAEKELYAASGPE